MTFIYRQFFRAYIQLFIIYRENRHQLRLLYCTYSYFVHCSRRYIIYKYCIQFIYLSLYTSIYVPVVASKLQPHTHIKLGCSTHNAAQWLGIYICTVVVVVVVAVQVNRSSDAMSGKFKSNNRRLATACLRRSVHTVAASYVAYPIRRLCAAGFAFHESRRRTKARRMYKYWSVGIVCMCHICIYTY